MGILACPFFAAFSRFHTRMAIFSDTARCYNERDHLIKCWLLRCAKMERRAVIHEVVSPPVGVLSVGLSHSIFTLAVYHPSAGTKHSEYHFVGQREHRRKYSVGD